MIYLYKNYGKDIHILKKNLGSHKTGGVGSACLTAAGGRARALLNAIRISLKAAAQAGPSGKVPFVPELAPRWASGAGGGGATDHLLAMNKICYKV